MKRSKVLKKLKKVYIKMLRRYALKHMANAHKLEDKAILLELQLKDQRQLVDEIDEGLDELKDVRQSSHKK